MLFVKMQFIRRILSLLVQTLRLQSLTFTKNVVYTNLIKFRAECKAVVFGVYQKCSL